MKLICRSLSVSFDAVLGKECGEYFCIFVFLYQDSLKGLLRLNELSRPIGREAPRWYLQWRLVKQSKKEGRIIEPRFSRKNDKSFGGSVEKYGTNDPDPFELLR